MKTIHIEDTGAIETIVERVHYAAFRHRLRPSG